MSRNPLQKKAGWRDPVNFKPYPQISLPGVLLDGTPYLVSINETVHPLLIGKGDGPRVWLSSPTDDTRKYWKYLVQDNVSLHPAIKVEKSDAGTLSVTAGGKLVVSVREDGDNRATVTALDLRQLGLEIYGAHGRMHLGTITLEEVTVKDSTTVLNID